MDDSVPAKQTTIDSINTKKEKRGKPNTNLFTTIKGALKHPFLSLEEVIELARQKIVEVGGKLCFGGQKLY